MKRRADPTNGLCLNALFDRAFDRGLITLDAMLRVVVSRRLREVAIDPDLQCSLVEAEGRTITVPKRFPPALDAIEYHRVNVFKT